MGLLLAFLLLAGGRLLRRRLLLGPDGAWRDHLWGDDLLAAAADAEAAEPAPPPRPRLTTPLPVNTCSEDSLTLLPGVGPKLAARIAASRDRDGPFAEPGDLQRVKGIGPALGARIAPFVHFGASADPAGPDRRKSP